MHAHTTHHMHIAKKCDEVSIEDIYILTQPILMTAPLSKTGYLVIKNFVLIYQFIYTSYFEN